MPLTYLRLGATNRALRNIEHSTLDLDEEDNKDLVLLVIGAGAIVWPLFIWFTYRRLWAGLLGVVAAVGVTMTWGYPMYLVAGVPISLLMTAILASRA